MKAVSNLKLDSGGRKQIQQCLDLFQKIFGSDLLGVYLYGSAVLGGLQKYSDLDLFVVLSRSSTTAEKTKLVEALLKISGIYMQDLKPPIELTVVVQSEVNPWRYPPKFDFQYGEWLREEFEQGNIEPWSDKLMPDLAILITQVRLSSVVLFGESADSLLPQVPYKDFMRASAQALPSLLTELETDTRNVLLTLARIWATLETDMVRSKPEAADWVLEHLPKDYIPVMKRAKAICIGQQQEYWEDLVELIKPCAEFIASQANKKFEQVMSAGVLGTVVTR